MTTQQWFEVRDDSTLAVASRPPLPAEWADHLVALLRSEIDLATRRGVINAGESEQLLARLVLVIDQALSADH
jgi:hypothetical protein